MLVALARSQYTCAMRFFRPLLLASLLALPLPLALADDGAEPARAGAPASEDPFVRYLLGLGPIGALVYGAFLLGKGVKVTVEVHLSSEDRQLADRATVAVEKLQSYAGGASPLPFPRAAP